MTVWDLQVSRVIPSERHGPRNVEFCTTEIRRKQLYSQMYCSSSGRRWASLSRKKGYNDFLMFTLLGFIDAKPGETLHTFLFFEGPRNDSVEKS